MAGDYLGGEAYWAGGLHLYTPLPFRPGMGGFGDLFRTHFFLNAGNLCNLNYGEILKTFASCWVLLRPWHLGVIYNCKLIYFEPFLVKLTFTTLGVHVVRTFICSSCEYMFRFPLWLRSYVCLCSGEGPQAHLKKLAECIRWSYGLGIVLRLGNIARLELNYCIPMGVQSGDR